MTIVSEVSITMGRNVGDIPMLEGKWLMLGNRVEDYISDILGHGPDDYYRGKGEWDDNREETLRLVWRVFGDVEHDALSPTLARLAREYGQDVIALAIGESWLVEAETDIREEVA